MKNDNTETSNVSNLDETELENAKGGAAINLDAFITVLKGDRLRNMVGMDRPKGLAVGIRDLSINVQKLRGL
jgi:hypothetical protein